MDIFTYLWLQYLGKGMDGKEIQLSHITGQAVDLQRYMPPGQWNGSVGKDLASKTEDLSLTPWDFQQLSSDT